MAVTAVLKGHGVLILSLEFLILVTRQTHRRPLLQQKLGAKSDVRAMALDTTIFFVERTMYDSFSRRLQEVFVAGKAHLVHRSHKFVGIHTVVTRSAFTVGKWRVLIRQQQSF
jgi:hypothetical protein